MERASADIYVDMRFTTRQLVRYGTESKGVNTQQVWTEAVSVEC